MSISALLVNSLFKLVVVQVTTVNYSLCLELETHGHRDSTQHSMGLCENCAQPAQCFASNVQITIVANVANVAK